MYTEELEGRFFSCLYDFFSFINEVDVKELYLGT